MHPVSVIAFLSALCPFFLVLHLLPVVHQFPVFYNYNTCKKLYKENGDALSLCVHVQYVFSFLYGLLHTFLCVI